MTGSSEPRRIDAPASGRVDLRVLALIFGLAIALLGIDQGVKAAVVANLSAGETVPLLGQAVQLHYVTNSGAAFSSFSGFTWVLSLVALGVIVFIVWFARRIHSIAWGFVFGIVLGGALGNVTDRFLRPPGAGQGHVVDFIQVWGFPAIFNIADIAVCTAMGLFILFTLRGIRLDGTRTPHEPRRTTDGGSGDGTRESRAGGAEPDVRPSVAADGTE